MEEQTVYKIETTDKKEMQLMLNAQKMAYALQEFIEWHSSIYNSRDYDGYILYKGKLYEEDEWLRDYNKIIDKEDLDTNGVIKEELYKKVYESDEIEYKLESLLYDVKGLVYDYYE